MAARNRKGLSEATRKRIQTTMLVKRLQKHALGELVEMPITQIKAIEVLLRKTLPDISPISLIELLNIQSQSEDSIEAGPPIIKFQVAQAKNDITVTIGSDEDSVVDSS